MDFSAQIDAMHVGRLLAGEFFRLGVCPIGGGRPVSCHWPIRRGWCAPKIYVCVCNAVNDRLVREAIDDGKRTVRALREHFGFDTGQ